MIEFVRLSEEHLKQVLAWRTKESVTRYMFTDLESNLDNQRKWYNTISQSHSDRYWIIKIKEKPVGVISLNQINYINNTTSWGFYIGEDDYRIYGGLVPPHLYNHVFYKLKLQKITAEVMEGNDNVMKLHKLHGYRDVAVYERRIYKYGQYHDIYVMELLKEQWALKAERYNKYNSIFEE